jgi:cell division protein FtsB
MTTPRRRPSLGFGLYILLTFALGLYFTFASVQGDYGLLRRLQIDAELYELQTELTALEAEVEEYRVKTRRLSNDFLDLDLLDQQARDVLGLARSDEIVLR